MFWCTLNLTVRRNDLHKSWKIRDLFLPSPRLPDRKGLATNADRARSRDRRIYGNAERDRAVSAKLICTRQLDIQFVLLFTK